MLGQDLADLLGLFRELEDIGRFLDQPFLVEQLDIGAAQSFDVERVAADEMLEPLHGLRRTNQHARAAAVDVFLARLLVHFAHGMAAADGAFVRKLIGLRALRPLLQDHAHDLRNDVAGALDHDRVADAHILARDLVFVVQRGVLHHHAADRDGLQFRDRRELAGAADLDVDVEQHGFGLLGREFVRDGPARAARHEAQPLLQIEAVDLVDDAVDVVAEAWRASASMSR